jgi:exodeoxyribonuclease-1
MAPLAMHPTNRNELLAWDLSADPSELAALTADEVRARLFTATADLPEGVARLPVKGVHLNKSPIVIGNLKVLTPALQARWGLDLDQALRHAATARDLPDMSAIWPEVFRRPELDVPVDPEHDLYGGFVGNADRRRLTQLRALDPVALARARTGFDDPRLAELLLRWRARNHPDTLTPDEAAQWQQHREAVLLAGEGGARTLAQLQERLDILADDAVERGDERAEAILGALADWAEHLGADLG